MPATNEGAKSMFVHVLVIQMGHMEIVNAEWKLCMHTDFVLLAVELEWNCLPWI